MKNKKVGVAKYFFSYFLTFLFSYSLSASEKVVISSRDKNVNEISDIDISQDNKFIAVATRYWVELRDIDTLQLIKNYEGFSTIVNCLAVSPDSSLIAVGCTDGVVRLWDVSSSKEIKVFKGHKNLLTCLVFSKDGRKLASADWSGNIYVWDVASGKGIKMKEGVHKAAVKSLAFSYRGDVLASGGGIGDNLIVLWNVTDGKVDERLTYHTSGISSLIFEKHLLYSASWDKTVRVWDTRAQTVSTVATFDDFVNSIAFSPDKEKIAVGGVNGKVTVMDIAAKRAENTIQPVSENLIKILYPVDGKIISAGDKNILTKNEIEVRISEVPEVGSDIWLDMNLGDIGELFDMLKDPASETVFLATEKKGLLKSVDGKTNWQQMGQEIKDTVTTLAMDDKKVLYVGTKSKGIFESKDAGTSFSGNNDVLFEVSPGVYPEVFDIEIQPKTNKKFIATGKGIFKKEKKWNNVSDKVVSKLCFNPKDNKKLYAGSKKGGLFLSNDAGKSFNLLLKEREEDHPVREIAVNPETDEIFVARGDEGVLVSADGKNFREKNFGLPPGKKTVYSLKIDSRNKNNVYVATEKGIFTSNNKGDTWKDYSDGMDKKTPPKAILVSDTGRVLAGGSGGLFEVGKVKEKKGLSSINFETGSDRIIPQAFDALNKIVESVKFRDKVQVIIHGHTDNVGDENYNMQLSINRAISIKNFFIEKGIAKNRIKTFGFGVTKPLVSNVTEEGRAKNRRVEILIAE